jgi:hypothetical protein
MFSRTILCLVRTLVLALALAGFFTLAVVL